MRAKANVRMEAGTGGESARAWQRMLSGRRLDLLDPSPLDIEIEDIAHGLARVARWNGQTHGQHALSVAQHSVLVERLAGVLRPAVSRVERMAALLHDAPEYVIGDLISPFKAAVGLNYTAFEARLQRAIRIRFGLPPDLPLKALQLIKQADKIAAYYEATALAGFTALEAKRIFGEPKFIGEALARSLEAMQPLDTAGAQTQYLERCRALRLENGNGAD